MMWKTVNHTIRNAFNHAAINYEALSGLHKEIARDLARKFMAIEARRIIDIGTGTGYLANKAKFYFPESDVLGLDISEGMLAAADKFKEGISLVQADAQVLPFKSESFDLIISNLAYQWMEDLPRSFAEAARCLSPKGTFAITMFGNRTLQELFNTLDATASGPVKFKRLPSQTDVENALAGAFQTRHVDYELIKIQFSDIFELLHWTKNIGANRLNPDAFLGKERLAKANAYYKEQYPYHNGICASFEVIWVQAEK